MNALTAILLSVLVHLGGVELDTTREASLQWYRDSEMTDQWELEANRAGAYRFVSDEGLVVVERLREGNMAYAVLHYETIEPKAGEATGPIPRALRSMGTVSLEPQAQNLRPWSSSDQLTVDSVRVPVAWTQVTPNEQEPLSTSPSGGTVLVSITPGQWSASHADSGQVIVLRVR